MLRRFEVWRKLDFNGAILWFGSGPWVGRGSKAKLQSAMRRRPRRCRPAFDGAADGQHASSSASARRFAGARAVVTATLGSRRRPGEVISVLGGEVGASVPVCGVARGFLPTWNGGRETCARNVLGRART